MNKTYIDPHFPYLELAYNKTINGCPKSHIHNKLTLTAIDNGELSLTINKDFVIKNGCVAIINPYQTHFATTKDTSSQNIYSLYIDKIWIESLQKELLDVKSYVSFEDNLIIDQTLFLTYIQLCKTLLSDLVSLEKEEALLEFFSFLILKYCKYKQEKEEFFLVDDIQNFIDKNFLEIESLEALAKEFLITPHYMIKIFKNKFLLTPYQYILNRRLEYAKELLKTETSIAQVAFQCKFNDQSHLYKYFRNVFSISPKEYQKSLLD